MLKKCIKNCSIVYKTGIFHIYKRRRVVLKGGAIASQKISRYGTTIWPKTYFSGIEIKHVRMYNVSRLWETFWHEKVHSTMALKCKKYSAKIKTRLLQNQPCNLTEKMVFKALCATGHFHHVK